MHQAAHRGAFCAHLIADSFRLNRKRSYPLQQEWIRGFGLTGSPPPGHYLDQTRVLNNRIRTASLLLTSLRKCQNRGGGGALHPSCSNPCLLSTHRPPTAKEGRNQTPSDASTGSICPVAEVLKEDQSLWSPTLAGVTAALASSPGGTDLCVFVTQDRDLTLHSLSPHK